ncbi:hypothetical protein CPB85DRAFT_469470 [Mucidula mucida]|nr:hypothetical protein CPB85DRAFT_469470 [Mucidula mucida]
MTVRVSPVLSVLISIWMETLFYGINVVLIVLTVAALLSGPYPPNRQNQVILALSVILFLCASAHMGVNLCRLVQGYIFPESKEGMIAYLLDLTQHTNVAKQYLLVTVNLFSDMLLTWRVYLVWDKSILITLMPVLLCTSVFIAGIGTAILESLVVPGETIFLGRISSWALAQFSLSLVMNFTATVLIASRIWYITGRGAVQNRAHLKLYWRIIIIIIESASFTAFVQIVQLGFYAAKFPGTYFVSDCAVQIVTMAPLMIIVLIGATRKDQSNVVFSTYDTRSMVDTPTLSGIRFAEKDLEMMAATKTVSTSRSTNDGMPL